MIPSTSYTKRKFEFWERLDRLVTVEEAMALTGLTKMQVIGLKKDVNESINSKVEPVSSLPQEGEDGEFKKGRPNNLYSLHDVILEAFYRKILKGRKLKGRSYDGKQ